MDTKTYSVAGMHCDHCKAAVRRELAAVRGVEGVDVDLETKLVTVRGEALDDTALIAAIDEAGYEATYVACDGASPTLGDMEIAALGVTRLRQILRQCHPPRG